MKAKQLDSIALWIVLVLSMTSAISATSASTPQGASPGSTDHLPSVLDGCPTFSWSALPGATRYELVAYELDAGFDVDSADQDRWEPSAARLFASVPGGATSWTPPAEERLPPGGSFVWFVRGITRTGPGREEASDWSEGRFFAVPLQISSESVREAVETLSAYLERGGDLDQLSVALDRSALATDRRTDLPTAVSRAVPAATAAIKGELPDTSGESYGIVGTSASPLGAGLAAVNTAGGADLILDGSSDEGAPDTLLSHSGIDRPSSSNESFSVGNSGTGSIDLHVDGTVSVSDSGLAALDVAGGINAGSGDVDIVDASGRVPAIDETTFADLDGSSLTGVDADLLDGLDSSSFVLAEQTCASGQRVQGIDSSGSLICGSILPSCTTRSVSFTESDGTIDCNPGETVTGGGFLITDGPDNMLNWNGAASYPSGNGYTCHRDTYSASTSYCYAICCTFAN